MNKILFLKDLNKLYFFNTLKSLDIFVLNDIKEMFNQNVEQLSIKKFPIQEMELNSKVTIIGKPGCYMEGTPILMHNGKIKNVEDVKLGDIVMGDDSTPRRVLDLCHNEDDMYKIKPYKGDEIIVNKKHKLVLKCTGYNSHPKGEIVEITVEDFIKKSKTFQKRYKWFKAPADFDNKELLIDPYVLGYWLGDGTYDRPEFTIFDDDTAPCDYLKEYFEMKNLIFKQTKHVMHWRVRSKEGKIGENWFINSLREYGLYGNKHIPHIYKCNTREKRLSLLAGFIDSDGSYDSRGNGFDIVQKREGLIDDVVFIARSLGLSAYKKKCFKRCTNSPDPNHLGTYYRIIIYGKGIEKIPVLLKRKKCREVSKFKDNLVTGFTIQHSHYGEYYGFTLDGNHRFLLGDFSVVRNTGKSVLLTDLLYQHRKKFPIGIIMSGTEESTSYFKGMVPDLFIYGGYNHDAMTKMLIRQKKMVRKNGENYPDNYCFVVLDDCMDDTSWIHTKVIKSVFKNGRHYDMFFLLAMQYCLGIPPALRTCIDYVFILREPNLKNRRKLWENYCSIFPTLAMFCDVMDNLTENYHCMVIKNRVLSNQIVDVVFWYKAKLHKPFKIGKRRLWEYHENNYNSHYESDEEKAELAQTDYGKYKRGRKKNQPTFIVNMED